MQNSRFAHRAIGALLLLSAEFGCGDAYLQTTSLADQNSDNSNTGVLSPTFFVQGRSLYDPCGQPVILRGINEMITFIPGKTGILPSGTNVFSEIAKTQANSVRLYWQLTDTADEIDVALTNAEQQKLIPIIYVFNYDSSDPSSSYATTKVSMAAGYWTNSAIASVIQKHSHWLIIALRERNLPTAESADDWATNYSAAVASIRNAGVNVPLAIDAPNEGSDIAALWQSSELARIAAADPSHNLLWNVNAWWNNYTADMITNALTNAQLAALPLIVGEFSGYAQPNCPQTQFDYATLLAASQQTGTGFLAWSWGGAKNFDCNPGSLLDMTDDGTYQGLVTKAAWGYDVAVGDANSIQKNPMPPAYSPGSACPAAN